MHSRWRTGVLDGTASTGAYVSFADLFMCLLVVMLFWLQQPSSELTRAVDTYQSMNAAREPLYLRLHEGGRLSHWQDVTNNKAVDMTQVATWLEEINATAIVLIGNESTVMDAYLTAAEQLTALAVPISYGREK